MELLHLPSIPSEIKGFTPSADKVLLMLEPLLPKTQLPKNVKVTKTIMDNFMKDMEIEMHERRLQNTSMRKAIVVAVPIDLDKSKFAYDKHSVVYVPNETNHWDVINKGKTPFYLCGTRDIRLVAPNLTAEEAKQWDADMETYRTDILYPENPLDSPMPAPRMKRSE